MRILHFLPVYAPAWNYGGPILSVSRLCEELVRQGVDVRVITTNAGLPDFPSEQLGIPTNVNGVQVTYYPVDRPGGTIRSRALVESLPDQIDWAELVHISTIWQPLGLPIQRAAHAVGVPVIQTLRGALGPYSWRRGWWKKIPYFILRERPLLQRASFIHCTTYQESTEIASLHLKPPIEILSNPLDLNRLGVNERLRQHWRARIGIAANVPLLIVVGRQHHKKGIDLIPDMLKSLAPSAWHILFIGLDEDGAGSMVRTRLNRYGLSSRCTWIDALPSHELSGPYNAGDCLVLPSRHENFGNVVVEALACGCGVLISDRVGVGESLMHCPGVIISPRRADLFTAHLNRILQTPRPGIQAENFVRHTFSSKYIASRTISLYSRILNAN